jgi:uncharacterized protein (DUF433 family)
MISQAESEQILYRGHSPRDVPRYTVAQASRYLNLPPSTLRSWIKGRPYQAGAKTVRSKPLIHVTGGMLSFSQLVEAHLMRALRVDERVRMSKLRTAKLVAERKYGIQHLMFSPDLRAAPGELFLERYGELINLGRSGQLAMWLVWQAHLKRVQWGAQGANKLFPFLPDFVAIQGFSAEARVNDPIISIDPTVSFGRPILVSKGIRTSAIVSRINADEDPDTVAQDYGIERYEVDAAIAYERAAA